MGTIVLAGSVAETTVVDRITALIESVTNIGLVYDHDIYAHDDLRPLIVSPVGGIDTLRAWWISGPTMSGEKLEQRPAGYQRRTWSYTIHGVEGLTEDGSDIATIRANALAISDKLDADFTLGGTCHRTWVCSWPAKPEHRLIPGGLAVSYVEIQKIVQTVSTPT